jgi:hypothetical protein
VEDFRRWSARQKGSRKTMRNGMDELDFCTTARAGSGFAHTNYCSGGISCARLSHTSLIQNLLQSITHNHRLRSIGVSRANIPFQMSSRFVISSIVLLQFHCLACAPESASRAATLSRAVCFRVSDCVCERCASSCLPSLPLPVCDALARSW